MLVKWIIFGIAELSILQAASFANLKELVAFKLSRNDDGPALRHLFSNFDLKREILGVAYLLAYPKYNFGQYYNVLDETQLGRIEDFIDPRMIEQTEFHETIYNPMKLLNNIPIARAIFAREKRPGPDDSSHMSTKLLKKMAKIRVALVGEREPGPSASIPRSSNFLGGISKAKAIVMGEQEEVQYEEVIYAGNFFGRNVPEDYFRRMYGKDRCLTMRILMFVVDNQMPSMRSVGWLEKFLKVADGKDSSWLFDKLSKREMTRPMLEHFFLQKRKQEACLEAFFGAQHSDDVLSLRCAMWSLSDRTLPSRCNQRSLKIDWDDMEDVYNHLETLKREPTPSRSFLFTKMAYRILHRGASMSHFVSIIIEELTRYEENMLSPYEVDSWLQSWVDFKMPLGEDFDRLLKSLPDHLKPLRYLSLGQRLDAWSYRGSFRRLASKSGCNRDKLIARAKEATGSSSSLQFSDDYYIMLALGFALAEGWKLNLGNVLEAFALHQPQEAGNAGDYFLSNAYQRLGLVGYMDIEEFRSLVDSSYMGNF